MYVRMRLTSPDTARGSRRQVMLGLLRVRPCLEGPARCSAGLAGPGAGRASPQPLLRAVVGAGAVERVVDR